MLNSMTGYGKGEARQDEITVTVEIKTVNHRYADISVKLPRTFLSLENGVRKQIGKALGRGKIDVYVNYVLGGIEKYGGHLITSDVSEHGDKLLITFGAPVSCEKQEQNAVRFACELNEHLEKSQLQLKHQIGINSGYVFAGEIGSELRREPELSYASALPDPTHRVSDIQRPNCR